jgi:outer membrane protein OmpA-like peptidoglycan-associated protein
VVFKPKSSALSARDRKVLNALAKRAGTSSTHAVVVKFAQKKSQTKKERTVSARQARNVAAFLKSKGVKGSYVIRAERAAGSGNPGRRVNITATYRSGC